jgi:hypothetical protein
LTPGFLLAGGLLAAVPIVIHLLNRRRYKVVQWAAMEFLLQAVKKNRRRLRFEQWLLLAARCAVMVLLGLALARPLGCGSSSLAALGERTGLHVFVIDTSYSMAYQWPRGEARSHLDQAKKVAETVINRLSPGGESVAVITAGAPSGSAIPKATYDLEAASGAVQRLEQTSAGTDLAGALQRALDVAAENGNQPVKRLYILTDSTRSALETPEAKAIQDLGRKLAQQYRITYFNLGRRDQANAAVAGLRPTSHLVTTKFNQELVADVRGFGPAASTATLQWRLDGSPIGTSSVTPDPKGVTVSLGNVAFKTGGPHAVTATLAADDRLQLDNTRQRVVEVASELKVLIVEGDRGAGPVSGSAAFLSVALAPPKEAGANNAGGRTDSYVAPETISDLELGNKVLTDYRAVVLTNVGSITDQQADALQKFVQQGGTLVVFAGELVNGDVYNRTLLPKGLLPGPLTRRMSVAADAPGYKFDFKPQGSLHPLLQILRGEERSGLDTAQVFTYWQTKLSPETKVERVLDYLPPEGAASPEHDPAITVHSVGSGRVVFFSTTANAEWTSLPAKPVYVTLMHELLQGSVAGDDGWLNLLVGQSLELPPRVRLSGQPMLTDPANNQLVLEQAKAADGTTVYRSPVLKRPGLYTLSTGAANYPVAVNAPEVEADVRTVGSEAIRQSFGNIEMVMEEDQPPAEVADSASQGRDFGWTVMLAVLGLVGLECFMAMSFGHYKR